MRANLKVNVHNLRVKFAIIATERYLSKLTLQTPGPATGAPTNEFLEGDDLNPAVETTTMDTAATVPIPKGQLSDEYTQLFDKLAIETSGRFIDLGSPDHIVNAMHFTNLVQRYEVAPGAVRVLNTGPKGIQLHTIYQGDRCLKLKRFEDFTYVRTMLGYMVDLNFINEIPPSLIYPKHRDGFWQHITTEREEDGVNPLFHADEQYHQNLAFLRKAVSVWMEDDPKGVRAFEPYLQMVKRAKLPDESQQTSAEQSVNVESNPNNGEDNEMEEVLASNEAEQTNSEIPSEESATHPEAIRPLSASERAAHERALFEHAQSISNAREKLAELNVCRKELEGLIISPPPKSREECEKEAFEASDSAVRISIMVDMPYEDDNPHPESVQFRHELLKLNPKLNFCAKCGDINHASQRCFVETAKDANNKGKTDFSKYEKSAWSYPNVDSVAAQGEEGSPACLYPFCRDRDSHVIAACPYLHKRCAICRTRGHDDIFEQVRDCFSDDGVSYTKVLVNCPLYAQTLQAQGHPDFTGRYLIVTKTWKDLQTAFEKYACHGAFTKYRFSQPSAGWYPITSEKEARIVKAIGYRWLNRISAEQSINLLLGIGKSCREVLGLPFQSFTDKEWEMIFFRREAKRSSDKSLSKKPKTANNAVEHTAPKLPRQAPQAPASLPGPSTPTQTYASAMMVENSNAALPQWPQRQSNTQQQQKSAKRKANLSANQLAKRHLRYQIFMANKAKKAAERQANLATPSQQAPATVGPTTDNAANVAQNLTANDAVRAANVASPPTQSPPVAQTFQQLRQSVADKVPNIGAVSNTSGAFHMSPEKAWPSLQSRSSEVIPPGMAKLSNGNLIPAPNTRTYSPAYSPQEYEEWDNEHKQRNKSVEAERREKTKKAGKSPQSSKSPKAGKSPQTSKSPTGTKPKTPAKSQYKLLPKENPPVHLRKS